MRILQQPCLKALILGRALAEASVQQPYDAVTHRHGRKLTACEDEIPYGDLLIHVGADPCVKALIVSADKDQMLQGGILMCLPLVEAYSLRGEKDNTGVLFSHCIYGL